MSFEAAMLSTIDKRLIIYISVSWHSTGDSFWVLL
jgi:hypothetical protein